MLRARREIALFAAAARNRWLKAAALAWGPLVALSTVATANHYLFDVAAGLAITVAGYLAVTYRPRLVRPALASAAVTRPLAEAVA